MNRGEGGEVSGEKRYPRAQARVVANRLYWALLKSCQRIEIAGSLRRKKADVGDIELLCIPNPTENLFFGDTLDEAIKGLIADGVLSYRPNIKGSIIYGPKNKLLVHVASGIPLDVFSTDAKNLGMAMVVRTGSADFNKRMMQRFIDLGMRGHAYGGITSRNGTEIECPDEETVFRHLGWDYIEPERRA